MMNSKKQKIFVGVSGGVDSSVVAYLLKKEGHDVHGVFIKTWSPEWLPCTWVDEKRDAMRVCASLDIPFHFLDAEREYKEGVADYMISEYCAGRTPNPDVLCNRVIKFGVLWHYVKANGADAIATGHYARTDGERLYKGVDGAKDQSYFLWMLKKDELAHVQFPIGAMQKSDVRAVAQKAKLFTATKRDSQGICFLGDVDMRGFLSHYIEKKAGEVVDEAGTVIGTHEGVLFHTLGERHGFTITETNAKRTPYYVVGKDIQQNRLIVSHEPRVQSHVPLQTVFLREANWLIDPNVGDGYIAQIRYHGAGVPAVVREDLAIELATDEVIALGQSLVVYDGEKVVGGGIIDKLS